MPVLRAEFFLQRALGFANPQSGPWRIPQWNDLPGTTQQDVVQAVELAAIIAEQDEKAVPEQEVAHVKS
jgi:hypothetical protein